MTPSALLLVAVLQVLSGPDLVIQGEAAGRLGAATEVCGRLGYAMNELVAEDVANRLAARAQASGRSHDEIAEAIASGVERERSALPFSLPLEDMPADELRLHAASLAAKAKLYCRRLNEAHPGVLRDGPAGEVTIDARLGAALRR